MHVHLQIFNGIIVNQMSQKSQYGDSLGNAIPEKSVIFSLIQLY